MTTGPMLQPPMAKLTREEGGIDPVRTLEDAERGHITAMLRNTNWVVGGRNGAAARLGLPRTTLIAKMRKLRIASLASGQPADHAHRTFGILPSKGSPASDNIHADDRACERASYGYENDSPARKRVASAQF